MESNVEAILKPLRLDVMKTNEIHIKEHVWFYARLGVAYVIITLSRYHEDNLECGQDFCHLIISTEVHFFLNFVQYINIVLICNVFKSSLNVFAIKKITINNTYK